MILPESLFAIATELPLPFTVVALSLLAALIGTVTLITVRLLRAERSEKPEQGAPQSDK